MNCFEINLNHTIRISLFGKEHLTPSRAHVARCIDTCMLYFVTEGELQLEVNGRQERLVPGDVYIFQKGDTQKPVLSTDVQYFYIHFEYTGRCEELSQAAYFDQVRQRDAAFARVGNRGGKGYDYLEAWVMQRVHIRDRGIMDHLISRFESGVHSFWSNRKEACLSMSVILAEVLLKLENVCVNQSEKALLGNNNLNYDRIRAISEFVSQNFMLDIARPEIEKTFLVNYDYANRNFKKIMGQSIVRYRNTLRIEYAKLLLSTTEKSILTIAEESGFGDKYYFSRYFKKMVGVSPLDYKKRT